MKDDWVDGVFIGLLVWAIVMFTILTGMLIALAFRVLA